MSLQQTMQSIQRLFDRVIGIAHYESALREQAHQIFSAGGPDFSRLEPPAYWRRSARIIKNRSNKGRNLGITHGINVP